MQTETFALGPLTMYVSENHRFGTDAFLLAFYAGVKPDSVVCDLCTGCGIIPLIFCKNVKPHLIYAVDIQEEAIDLLKMSVEKNHLENVLQPVLADLRVTDGKPVKEVSLVYPKETLKEHVAYEVQNGNLHITFKEPVMARIFEVTY